jgi:hypothetical protein
MHNRIREREGVLDRLHNSLPPQAVELTGTWAQRFEQLCLLAPELRTVRALLRRQRRSWANYERAKRIVSRIVGWHAADPRLRTSGAYDVALWAIAREVAP